MGFGGSECLRLQSTRLQSVHLQGVHSVRGSMTDVNGAYTNYWERGAPGPNFAHQLGPSEDSANRPVYLVLVCQLIQAAALQPLIRGQTAISSAIFEHSR